MKNYRLKSRISVGLVTVLISMSAVGFGTDPVSSYISQGNVVGSWQLSLSNSLNWFVPLENHSGQTPRKNLTVKQKEKDDGTKILNLKWKGKVVKNEWGGNTLQDTSFTISKNLVDLSPVANVAAIAVELRVKRAPNLAVKMSMRCNNSNECKGEYPMKALLRSLKKNTWTTIPIPLSCFGKDESFDFTKITDVMAIATQGKLEIDIANVGLVALPAGSKSC